jgi:hypothetical protein
LFDALDADYPDLDLQLLTALAEGADRLVAQVALQLGIPLIVILPMAQAEYEKDFESTESLAEFHSLLAKAQQTVTLSSASGEDSLGRDSQYAQLGLFISNHCQVLLTLWDGKPFNAVGGTAQVVNYHLTGVMEGFEGDLSPASLLADNENDLVHQIVCSRDRPDGEPADGLTALDSFWFSSRRDGERTGEMPQAYRLQLGRMQQFARDWQKKKAIVHSRSSSLLEGKPKLEVPTGVHQTDRLFQAADSLGNSLPATGQQQSAGNSLTGNHDGPGVPGLFGI